MSGVVDSLFWIPAHLTDLTKLKRTLTLIHSPPKAYNPQATETKIPLWEVRGGMVGVPRAFGFRHYGKSDYEDRRSEGRAAVSMEFTGVLGGDPPIPEFDQQASAVESAIYRLTNNSSNGTIVEAPCGSGKTVIGIAVACRLRRPTLILVHKEFLADQWTERLLDFTNIRPEDIGRIQRDRCDFEGKPVAIAMIQSLVDREYPEQFWSWPGLVIADEVHRMGAPVWGQAIRRIPSKYRLGLSATPDRVDRLDRAFRWHIGEVDVVINTKQVKPKVAVFDLPALCPNLRRGDGTPMASTMLSLLAGTGSERVPGRRTPKTVSRPNKGSVTRNVIIADEISQAAKADRKILVLSDRIPQLRELSQAVSKRGEWLQDFYIGGRKKLERKVAERAQIIWATYGMAREALDIPSLDTLVLALPKSDVEQAVGRILRVFPGKKHPLVLDFVDPVSPFDRQGQNRQALYANKGYAVQHFERT